MTDRPSDSGAPGPLIARGRANDVFDIGNGKVLRRAREPNRDRDVDIAHEIRIMRFMADHGVRVPEVFEIGADHHPDHHPDHRPDHRPETDIVMEHIEGPTLFDDLEQRPWKILAHAKLLAQLQWQIADVVAPDWMLTPSAAATAKRRDDSVLHLDLHPMNVLMSPDGPVIIDWKNAAGGPAGFDAALTYTMIASFEVESRRDRIAQKVFIEAFKRTRGSGEIDAFLIPACEHRLADAGITPTERVSVAKIRTEAIAAQARASARSGRS